MAYLILQGALERARERANAPALADSYLTELLQMSAGMAPGEIIHYRPFICAARWLEQNRKDQTIRVADGATFTNQATPIRSLYELQLAYDLANSLTIPIGWEVPLDLTSGGSSKTQRLSTRSISAQARP